MIEGDTVTRHIALDPRVLDRMPAARHLLELPEYRNLICYAGSSSATPMVYLQTILSGAHPGPPDPQTDLHTDTFHPTVKAWLFLNDVAADAMPFVYVPGSHLLTPQRLDWERRMAIAASGGPPQNPHKLVRAIAPETLAALGLPPPRAIAVPANTLVVADTFGFHARGPSARPTARVEIWAMGRRNPFLPWAGFDPWANPGSRNAQAALLLEVGRPARPLRARPPALAALRPGVGLRPGIDMDELQKLRRIRYRAERKGPAAPFVSVSARADLEFFRSARSGADRARASRPPDQPAFRRSALLASAGDEFPRAFR